MTNETLRALSLDHGSDTSQWTRDQQRAAVAELFEQDETGDWIGDCLIAAAMRETERLDIIRALKIESAVARHAALGVIFERALVKFPLDTLSEIADENLDRWRMEERQARDDAETDSQMRSGFSELVRRLS